MKNFNLKTKLKTQKLFLKGPRKKINNKNTRIEVKKKKKDNKRIL